MFSSLYMVAKSLVFVWVPRNAAGQYIGKTFGTAIGVNLTVGVLYQVDGWEKSGIIDLYREDIDIVNKM